MTVIKQYELKNGTKKWMFKTYLGVNPKTGGDVNTTRRGFDTKKEAQLTVTRLKASFDDGTYFKDEPSDGDEIKTFKDVFDLWKVNYELTVKESTYCKAISQYEVHTLPVFGDKRMDEISIADIQRFANANVKKFVKYRDFVTDVSRIFEYAINLGIIKDNPAIHAIIPKRKESLDKPKRQNYYTKNELKQFLELTKAQQTQKAYTFMKLSSASGCRQGELLGLEWQHVDFESNSISIVQTLAMGKGRRLYLEQPKTKHSKRTISIDPETMVVLKRWKVQQSKDMLKLGYSTLNKHQLVFSNDHNEFLHLTVPRKWLMKTITNNGLRVITIHGLRHTHATLLLEAGVSPKIISERLGHASIQITLDLYSHVTDKMEKTASEVFAKAMDSD
jgi:integrase